MRGGTRDDHDHHDIEPVTKNNQTFNKGSKSKEKQSQDPSQ